MFAVFSSEIPPHSMVEMKQLTVCLVSLVLLASVLPSQAGPTQLRARREARPLLGGLVSDLASPFINFFRSANRDSYRDILVDMHGKNLICVTQAILHP